MDKLEIYGKKYQQFKQLESELKELKEMLEVPEEGIKTELGSFYYTARKSWKYSSKVNELETNLKDLKKSEERTGKAKYVVSMSLGFKLSKID